MKAILFGLRALWRDIRSGELLILTVALIVAAGSVTAIGFLTDRIEQAIALQANEILAADVRLTSTQPITQSYLEHARSRGLVTARTLNFPSVVFSGEDASALAQINAVSGAYPLRGQLEIADNISAPARPTQEIPARGEVWLDTALLARLGALVNDTIELGAAKFRISQVLSFRPDQSPGFSGFAPSLLMNLDDVTQTGLVQTGSRVRYAQLYAGTRDQVEQLTQYLGTQVSKDVRIQSQGNASDMLSNAIERAGRFLALASLVSLLLSAVAIAMSARHYARRRLDTAALMKSVGAQQKFIMISAITQMVIIGFIASLLGALLGLVAEHLLIGILQGMLRDTLPSASWQPLWLAFGTVLILLAGFALPALIELSNTPPARVLRKDLQPPGMSTWLTNALAVVALSLLIYWSVRDFLLLAVIVGGTLVSGLVLFLVGRVLVALLSSRRGGVGVAWRYGIANVARRGRESAVQIVAFGLGLLVLLVLTLVRNDLLEGWRATIDQDAPNQFMINIQPDEIQGVEEVLANHGLQDLEFTPLVRARLVSINDQSIAQREFANTRGKRMAEREANLTYAEDLSRSNKLVSGQWWSENPESDEVSVEVDVATDLGIDLGDELQFDVAGERVSATITSLREVKWDSFEPNFFMVFSPSSLKDYPQTFISSIHVDVDQRAAIRELAREYPSVSVIDVQALLDQVRTIIDKAALAVQAVFLFTLLSGLVVLFASVQSTLDERRYESALLRTFGASKRTVLAGLGAEFMLLGLAAGLFAAFGASIVGGLAATRLFQLPYEFDPSLWLVGAVSGLLLVGLSGLIATYRTLNEPPVRVLR